MIVGEEERDGQGQHDYEFALVISPLEVYHFQLLRYCCKLSDDSNFIPKIIFLHLCVLAVPSCSAHPFPSSFIILRLCDSLCACGGRGTAGFVES